MKVKVTPLLVPYWFIKVVEYAGEEPNMPGSEIITMGVAATYIIREHFRRVSNEYYHIIPTNIIRYKSSGLQD
jgi:hypothetical protein